jgi:prepilin-type processing-associated H-X9-DG protein
VTIDPVSGERFIYVGGAQQLSKLQTTSVLAYSPTDKKGRAVLFADGHVELANRKHFSELTNRGLVELALADVPARRRLAEAPATPPPAAMPAEVMPSPATEAAHGETMTVATGPLSSALDKEKSKGADLGVELAGADRSKTRKPEIAGAAGREGESSAIFRDQTAGFVAVQTNSLRWTAGIYQRFARTDTTSGGQYGLKSDDMSGKVVSVLASFQVVQNGSELQVVDGDGSVYRGYVQTRDTTIQTRTATDEIRLTTNESQSLLPPVQSFGATSTSVATLQKALAPVRQFEEKDALEGKGGVSVAPNYFFRVAGTNLSLKQSVVFTGTLQANAALTGAALMITNGTPAVSSSNLGGGGGGGGGGAQNAPVGQTPPWSLSNARISGTAVIGGTNQIEINAMSAALP